MKITLKQIAREAGVSQATVSRLVNQNTGVSSELEEKVTNAAKKLGVELPRKSSAVKSNQTKNKVIGLLVTDLSNPYFQVIMRGVIDEARILNYGVQIFETYEDIRSEEEAIKTIERFKLDGAILSASRISENKLINFHKNTKIPIALMNRYVKEPEICCIIVDFQRSLFQATTHLIDLGHKKIAYLSGPSNSDPSKTRRAGIVKALEQANLKLEADLCVGSFPNVEGGFQAMISLLSLSPDKRPTAVLAYNDLIAVGALRAIRMKGLQVPNDISIIGVDNIDMSEHTYPPLTTISPPKVKMGSIAMRAIYRMNMGEYYPTDGYIEVDAPLTLRYSTGPVKHNPNESI